MIELVVFDVAGTTVLDTDNAVAASVVASLRGVGIELGLTRVDPVMGMPKPLAIQTLLAEARGAAPSVEEVTAVHADFQRRMIDHYAKAPGIAPMPGAEDVFRQLRERGIKIGLDTGFDRAILDAILTRLGWDDGRLDATVTSDEVGSGRPAPDMIHVLMQKTGVGDPAHVAKIGDSESDLDEGVNAGCGMVFAMRCARTIPILDRYADVRAVDALSELVDAIDEVATVA